MAEASDDFRRGTLLILHSSTFRKLEWSPAELESSESSVDTSQMVDNNCRIAKLGGVLCDICR